MARFRSTIRSGLLYAPPLRRLVDQRDELQGTVESLVALVEQRDATIAEERGQLAQARRDRDELRARASGLTDRIRELERALLDLRRRAPDRPHQTVFQGFWHGPPLDVVLRACLQSFIEQGHAFHLYVYEPVDVPDGVVLMDANEVIPFEEIFYYRDPTTGRKDLGPFSDLFRFRLLDMRGGWWVDVDTVCLSSHIPQADSAWAREFPEYSPAALGTSSIALSEGSDLAKTLYEECLALSRAGYKAREALGPDLLSRVIGERGLPSDNFGNTVRFYPIRWIEAFKLWLPQFCDEVSTKAGAAQFLALWQSVARYQGIDLSKAPPTGSYLDQVCERFGTANGDGLRQDAATSLSNVRHFFVENDWAADALRAVAGGEGTLLMLGVN